MSHQSMTDDKSTQSGGGVPHKRRALSVGLAILFGLAFAPLGCESTPEAVAPRVEATREYKLPDAPPGVEAALRACVEEGVGRLKDKDYAVLFNVRATSDGHVDSATVRDSMLGDHGIESCMVRVLAGMSLPESITTFRPPVPASMADVVPETRGLIGNAAALGGVLVNLVPIVINAAGVTILVGIGILIYRELSEEEKENERCKEVKQRCIDKCIDEKIPTNTPSGDPFLNASETAWKQRIVGKHQNESKHC